MWRCLLSMVLGAGICTGEVVEESIEYAGAKFRVVRLDPGQVQLVWESREGGQSFEGVRKGFKEKGKTLKFIMNAGIYDPGCLPTGLHIEKGKLLRPLNLRDGEGNFYLKPNGVFMIGKDGSAEVIESTRYTRMEKDPRLAVQSGPLLLIDGKRHPAFRKGSPNLKHRNGVGVDEKGRVVFAMTDKKQEVVFWDFGGLFLKLGCKDALFLDGDISQMRVSPEGPLKSNRFAAMFVVVE